MKLSAFNENYLKNKLNEDDNVGAIQELTERIEGMEKDMYEELNTGYLHVINKCSKLERLSNYIKNVQNRKHKREERCPRQSHKETGRSQTRIWNSKALHQVQK